MTIPVQELSHVNISLRQKYFVSSWPAADWSQVLTTSLLLSFSHSLEECYNEAFHLCKSSFINVIMQLRCLRPCWWVEGQRLYVKRCQKGDTGYKEYDWVYRKAVRAAKTAYYAEQFEANASNLRKTWGLVRECQGKSQTQDTITANFYKWGSASYWVFKYCQWV